MGQEKDIPIKKSLKCDVTTTIIEYMNFSHEDIVALECVSKGHKKLICAMQAFYLHWKTQMA